MILDGFLVLLIIGRAIAGWRSGALVTVLSLVGLVIGAVSGLWATPYLLEFTGLAGRQISPSLMMLVTALVGSAVGQALLGAVGHSLRRAAGASARGLDAILGGVAALLVSSLAVWFVGAAVRPLLPESWGRTVNSSRVLTTLDTLVPGQLVPWPSKVTEALRSSGIPRIFGGLTPEPELPASAPEDAISQTPAVQQAAASVIKIASVAPSCNRSMTGSGWVVTPERVVTNAHVVAGASTVTVQTGGRGVPQIATVVAFDPELDLAILSVPGLAAKPLGRAGDLPAQSPVAAAGFPLGRPYTLTPARVRGVLEARGENIYGDAAVTREVYSIRGTLYPGNSGGPLLTAEGTVAGTVFAASLVHPETGYALTDDATDALLDGAAGFRSAVPTGACTR